MERGTTLRVKGARAIGALLLGAMLLATGCAATQAPPSAEKVVQIGDLEPLTGHGASSAQIVFQAIQDYVRYFNEHELVPGLTVKISWMDVGVEPVRAISCYRRIMAADVPILMSSASSAEALKAMCARDRVPLLTPNTTDYMVYPPGWVYCTTSTYAEQFAVLADFILDNWHEQRPPRLCIIAPDATWGRLPLPQMTKYATGAGFDLLPTEFVPFVTLDATTQLLRIDQGQADFVYIQGLPVTVGPILKDAERLGLLDTMEFCGVQHGVGDTLIEAAGATCDGYLTPKSYASFDETEVPGVKAMLDAQMAYHGRLTREPEYLAWVQAVVGCEAIARAVERVGYEELDGDAIRETLDGMKDFDVQGIARISYTPEDHRGNPVVAVYQIQGRKVLRISEWRQAPALVP